ncbi:U-box domain-containing protein 3-like isoform X2 [Chenopodium quinoa]|uniref:U-box domain-containing protein 3-like isoform X2 n=1 Tax=Chenopodium quinoa TaxID=63459 RepID=UPI000B794D5D|nr:U-box domain-containing protein 3-like isoform X2 [Chenopodium quinoa]
METTYMRCLNNSISRFIHLMSCQTSKAMPTQNDFESLAIMLKHLKPVLDEINDDDKIASEGNLWKECEDLDAYINSAREFMERWSLKMSKLLTVSQSEQLLKRIRSSSLEICGILCRLLRTSSSSSSFAGVQHCVQELQSWQPERISVHIEQALKIKNDSLISCSEHLAEIAESLSLASNQELLKESIAVEKERVKVHANKCTEKVDQINQIVDLLALIRDYMLTNGCFGTMNGIPIPSYFRCPLSLDFMLDPVIVASGQTFERSSIQIWLDHGLNTCPKTRQYLSHTNIIPNYTVKALIATWFQENNLKPPISSDSTNADDSTSAQDVIRTDSFRCSVHSSDSMSRSSLEIGDAVGRLNIDDPSVSDEVSSSMCQGLEAKKFNNSSPEHSYAHSRTHSATSAVSSCDYMPSSTTEISRISDRHENVGEIMSERSTCNSLSGRGSQSAKTSSENGSNNYSRVNSLSFSDSGHDETTTPSHVDELVEKLKSPSNALQTAAAAELRLLAKHNMNNRIIAGKCGAIGPLISLLQSDVKITQEHAVTALLNLSLNEEIKARIAEAGVIKPLIHVLKTGTDTAKENSAAALFSLSLLEDYKSKIGRSGASKVLVDLLARGTVRGKKDAATALFNLSICHENKARIVQAGAVKHLIELLDPPTGMVDKSVALLANLSTISEGRMAIAKEGGIPLIVEIVESGSQRGKENAASVLLQLCLNSPKFCNLVLQEGAVPPLVALSQSGTPRAKEKAQQLLSHFRTQREGAAGKKKK